MGEGLGVGLVDEDLGAVGHFLGAELGVLAVFGFVVCKRGNSSTFHGGSDGVVFGDCCVARGDGVNVFFVGGPEEGPVEVDDIAAGSLL